MSITRMTSASGLVRIRHMNLSRTFSDGVPYEVPSTTPGNRVPTSTTSFHSGIGLRAVADRGMRAAVHEQGAFEADHDGAVLVAPARADGDDAHVRPRLRVAHLEHLGLRVDRVALEDRG